MNKRIFGAMLAVGFCMAAGWSEAAKAAKDAPKPAKEAAKPAVQPAKEAVPAVQAATNAPIDAATNAPAPEAAAPTGTVSTAIDVPPPPEWPWTGYVRTMRDAAGEVQAIRLVAGDKLLAVETDSKGHALALATPKNRKVRVKGSLQERDGRSWLTVTDFQEAPEIEAPGQAPNPPAVPVAPAAGTNDTAAAGTNAASMNAASTNAVPAARAQP